MITRYCVFFKNLYYKGKGGLINLKEKSQMLYAKGWKVMLFGIIILIAGICGFLKTTSGDIINTASGLIIIWGLYIIISTLIKLNNFHKYGIEYF